MALLGLTFAAAASAADSTLASRTHLPGQGCVAQPGLQPTSRAWGAGVRTTGGTLSPAPLGTVPRLRPCTRGTCDHRREEDTSSPGPKTPAPPPTSPFSTEFSQSAPCPAVCVAPSTHCHGGPCPCSVRPACTCAGSHQLLTGVSLSPRLSPPLSSPFLGSVTSASVSVPLVLSSSLSPDQSVCCVSLSFSSPSSLCLSGTESGSPAPPLPLALCHPPPGSRAPYTGGPSLQRQRYFLPPPQASAPLRAATLQPGPGWGPHGVPLSGVARVPVAPGGPAHLLCPGHRVAWLRCLLA